MSSAISRHDQASRSWWSSKHAKYPAQPKDMPQDYTPGSSTSSTKSSSSKFNSLTSVFKSKKHPSLAIQDPPLPPTRPVLSAVSPSDVGRSKSQNVQYTRPPSKSVSSTLSQAESSEPRTPVDSNREMHHQSLLTLSDTDPFASHGIFIPHSPVDPNRLSVYSNSSITEYSKRSDAVINRGSYASSSSQSNYYGDSPSFSPTSRTASSPDIPARRKLTSKYISRVLLSLHFVLILLRRKSGGDLRRNGSMHSSVVSAEVTRNVRDAAWETHPSSKIPIIKNSSSVTLTDKNRLSQPDTSHVTRPSLRARGLTESGGIHPPNFLFRDSVKSPDRDSTSFPRVIVRQASIQRMGLPPSAPPTQRLPLPPSFSVPIVDDDADIILSPDISGGSASSSFTSSMREPYMANQHYIPREDRAQRDTSPELEKSPLSSPKASRTLKKSISHQSLTKRGSSSGSPAPPTIGVDPVVEKAPRKQRSFHHTRLPMIPPLPLPLRHSSNSVATSAVPLNTAGDATSILDKRGSSSGGSASGGRKRLFSGSHFGRHSTSQGPSSEEDKRSVFSLPVESACAGGSSLLSQATLSPSSSFWDESTPDIPSSPRPEYVPQSILSPAELLEVEANIQDALNFRKQSREHGYSVVSSSTAADDDYGSIPEGLAAPFSLDTGPNLGISLPSLHSRSSMQPTLPSSITSNSFFSYPLPSDPPHSLPPPPRRSRPKTSPAHNDNGIKPLSPPPRTKVRRKVSVEGNLRPNLMMRKPSFLDIDDGFDHHRVKQQDPPSKVNVKEQIHDSFLDLARESFDGSRSDDP
ncbi:uncharacterized protein BT62DRAFT_1071508 [Guyanagaster necrorhizus]|uniref:Uncharacterized protein n=1 Tax=Guyanagaster necrorhizus TaxID=856835 RepID=A0A9P8AZV9_9AGAR|nr:uncharacterized protein BT62DRAFT_1071508 [Guyanagaster necrorhizus MCA 3950]KAG7452362.1 hypothetical protein BT62DRAFT_1071508 [Guyanagaster necrorhizus MCA 3950]